MRSSYLCRDARLVIVCCGSLNHSHDRILDGNREDGVDRFRTKVESQEYDLQSQPCCERELDSLCNNDVFCSIHSVLLD